MQVSTGTTANQLYKQQRRTGLTTLDFKSWLTQQKASNFSNATGDGTVPVNTGLNASIQDVITQMHQEGGLQTTAGTTYIFGINKTVLIWTAAGAGVLITGIIIYKLMHRK